MVVIWLIVVVLPSVWKKYAISTRLSDQLMLLSLCLRVFFVFFSMSPDYLSLPPVILRTHSYTQALLIILSHLTPSVLIP